MENNNWSSLNITDKIKFMETDPITAVCIYHKGSYDNLRDSYNIILKYKLQRQ